MYTYQQLDILRPVLEDLEGKYDFVHVRLLLRALVDYPVPALDNMIAMLSIRVLYLIHNTIVVGTNIGHLNRVWRVCFVAVNQSLRPLAYRL